MLLFFLFCDLCLLLLSLREIPGAAGGGLGTLRSPRCSFINYISVKAAPSTRFVCRLYSLAPNFKVAYCLFCCIDNQSWSASYMSGTPVAENNREAAAKCFLRPPPDMPVRYRIVSRRGGNSPARVSKSASSCRYTGGGWFPPATPAFRKMPGTTPRTRRSPRP